ncbi:MAG: protein-disulfide reductase DsbD family protein [Bacteroidaceae bacterium]
MKRLLFLLLAFVGLWVPCQAQFQSPVTFRVVDEKTPDGKLLVRFVGQVDAGWHVYATDIPEGGPTAASLTIEKVQGLRSEGNLRTVGDVHRAEDPMFGMEVSYMEGVATFEQTFVITAEEYSVEGYMTYGACNDENCIPPTDVEFSLNGKSEVSLPALQSHDTTTETLSQDTVSVKEPATLHVDEDLWAPVIQELHQTESSGPLGDRSLMTIFFLGILGGLVALLTPCVWPIIPMTVSFFLKRSKDNRRQGIRDAMTYGVSIVVIYVLLGLIVTAFFGASKLNELSTNALFNVFFFLLLVLFGISFLGGFELSLPSRWTNAVDRKSESTSGLLSIFLMAFTLSLVSFSCTGPIIGFLLVEVSTSGALLAPTVGMFGFALALALPFTLFALFPTWLKSVPKSGNWMNCIKVCLGFIELAFSLKFLSVADLAYGWHILDREVFLCLWIVIFAFMGAYLVGWIRFPHDEDEFDEMGEVVINPRTGVIRFLLALVSFAFALYMIPGLWGAPCKAVSAFAPPMSTQDFRLGDSGSIHAQFTDYEEGMAYARQQHKPVLVDFTGYGCVNCRKMEAAVWTDPQVVAMIKDHYVLISLYVDEKTPLDSTLTVTENGSTTRLRTVGDKWSYLQRVKFGANAQPFYVLLDNEGKPLAPSYAFDESVTAYLDFLNQGLRAYSAHASH